LIWKKVIWKKVANQTGMRYSVIRRGEMVKGEIMAGKFPYTLDYLRKNIVLDYFTLKYPPWPKKEEIDEAFDEYRFIFGKDPPPSEAGDDDIDQYHAVRDKFNELTASRTCP
jgi:hypothetical protein